MKKKLIVEDFEKFMLKEEMMYIMMFPENVNLKKRPTDSFINFTKVKDKKIYCLYEIK